jgi:uncharacterized protein YhfF
MDTSKKVMDYWERFRKESGTTEASADAWSFGDNPELADELLRLVLTGKKTGTATLVIELEKKGEKMPKIGDYNVILDGKIEPRRTQNNANRFRPKNRLRRHSPTAQRS